MSCSRLWLSVFFLVSACGGTATTTGQEHAAGGDSPGGSGAGGAGAGGASAGAGVGVAGGGSAGAAVGGSGGHLTREPMQHRAEATACGVPPPGGGAAGGSAQGQAPPPQPCTQNSDCTSGPNGRCFSARIGPVCMYDECFADADCAAGGVCLCSGPGGAGNRCSSPGCQVDADCPGSWCSPTLGSCGNYGGIQNYSCHSAQDECVDDTDCTGGGAGSYCMYDPQVTHWICSSTQCVG
jgi:hypothetical protein